MGSTILILVRLKNDDKLWVFSGLTLFKVSSFMRFRSRFTGSIVASLTPL